MPGTFISYRRQDSASEAGRLYDSLRSRLRGEQVFRDIYALRPGEDYTAAINRVIAASDIVLVLIGTRWSNAVDETGRRRLDDPDDLHRREITTALQEGKVVVPVLVQGASMPAAAELPAALAALAERNAIELTDSRWDYDVGRLLAFLRQRKRSWRDRPAARIGATAAVVAAVAIAIVGIASTFSFPGMRLGQDNPPIAVATVPRPDTTPATTPRPSLAPTVAPKVASAFPTCDGSLLAKADASKPILGIDVSRFDGSVDWVELANRGYSFAIIKATEGTTSVDPMLPENWKGAGDAGFIRSTYHFLVADPDVSGDAQADFYLSTIGNLDRGTCDLPPVLDFEKAPTGGVDPIGIASAWLQRVSAGYPGRTKPIMYSGKWFLDQYNGAPQLKNYPFWIASYSPNATPVPPQNRSTYDFWSFSDKSVGNVHVGEQIRFLGTREALFGMTQ